MMKVEEETGFDMSDLIQPEDFVKTQVNTQDITMFIVKGIDEATVFETQTRKEIGAIEWVPLVDLPTWVNKKGPKRTGGKGQKRFYNVTPFVGPLKKWLQKNGINPYPPRKRGKEDSKAAARERDLDPYTFNDSSSQLRQLEPFSFGQEHHAEHHGPSTAIDHLFAKFVQKDQKADNTAALQSDTARNLDQMFCELQVSSKSEEQQEYDRQDQMLAQLLGNVGTIQQPPRSEPPANDKQSKLLSLLNTAPKTASKTPPQSAHQNNLLAMLGPPPGSAPPQTSPLSANPHDERAYRHRALLESTLTGLGPATPVKGSHGISSPGQIMSPMAQLPPSQTQGWQYPNQPSPLAQPQQQSPYHGGLPQQQSPYHGAQPQLQSPYHNGQPQHLPSPQARPDNGYAAPQPQINDRQRTLLGALSAAKPPSMQGVQTGPPGLHGYPPQGMPPSGYDAYSPQHQPPPQQAAYGSHIPPGPNAQRPPNGHIQQPTPFSNGPPGQYGLNAQPRPPPPPGWQGQGSPYGPPPPGYGPPPPGPPPQGHPHQYGPPPVSYQQQRPPPMQQGSFPPPPQPMHIQAVQPPQQVQSPPMHQPVARPPVGGPLLSLAAGH